MVTGTDLNADGVASRARVQCCGEGSQRFGEHHVGTAMQDACNLRVALNGHAGDYALSCHLAENDPHFHHQRSDAGMHQPAVQVFRDPGFNQFGDRRRSRDGGLPWYTAVRCEFVAHGN